MDLSLQSSAGGLLEIDDLSSYHSTSVTPSLLNSSSITSVGRDVLGGALEKLLVAWGNGGPVLLGGYVSSSELHVV